MRTIRIGVLNLSLTVGLSFGIALSGILFQKLGFYGIYIICTILYVLGLLYGYAFIKDKKKKSDSLVSVNNAPIKEPSFRADLREFFDLKHIINAFGVTFRKGNDNRRARIIMMMLVLMIIMGPMTG